MYAIDCGSGRVCRHIWRHIYKTNRQLLVVARLDPPLERGRIDAHLEFTTPPRRCTTILR